LEERQMNEENKLDMDAIKLEDRVYRLFPRIDKPDNEIIKLSRVAKVLGTERRTNGKRIGVIPLKERA
jgi:hypothetical protein